MTVKRADLHNLTPFLLTVLSGLSGGVVFFLAKLPAPWLSGGMVGVVLLLASGRKAHFPDALRDFGLLIAGVAMGSAITPEMIRALERYPVSLLSLVLTTFAITFGGAWLMQKVFGWRRDEGVLSSMPGALSAVVAVATEMKADTSRILTVQTFRMFILVGLLPSVLGGTVGVVPQSVPPVLVSGGGFAIVMALALVLTWIVARLGLLSPFLLGGMLAAGLTHATDLIPGVPPPFLADLAMALVGLFAGSRLSGISWIALKRLFIPGLALFILTMAIALIGAMVAVLLTRTPVPEALIAFAPGGLEAMVVLGLGLGLDPLYVSSHHIARFVLITAALPVLGRIFLRPEQ